MSVVGPLSINVYKEYSIRSPGQNMCTVDVDLVLGSSYETVHVWFLSMWIDVFMLNMGGIIRLPGIDVSC